ncbi:MAG: 30S ribosomal protein S6 [Elusimicrobia bacterium]|nr:30S ribosomal protein S6 [Elusimicrobiota bacterium]
MLTYETIILVHPRLSDAEVGEFAEKTKAAISKGGGEVLGDDRWGRRKLAYPIKNSREGFYLYLKYNAKGALVNELNRQFRIQEDILRTLTVHAEDPAHFQPKPRAPKPAPAV